MLARKRMDLGSAIPEDTQAEGSLLELGTAGNKPDLSVEAAGKTSRLLQGQMVSSTRSPV